MFAGSREAVRIVYRDPEHVSERLTLYAIARLAGPTARWAEEVRTSRVDTLPRRSSRSCGSSDAASSVSTRQNIVGWLQEQGVTSSMPPR
jgi:hypothetical protein